MIISYYYYYFGEGQQAKVYMRNNLHKRGKYSPRVSMIYFTRAHIIIHRAYYTAAIVTELTVLTTN